MMKPGSNRILGLDILRSLAILLVLISHTRPYFVDLETGPRADFLATLGFLGVELFFSLSGFLIGGILIKKLLTSERFSKEDLMQFWSRRWFRTIPNYYLFLGIYALGSFVSRAHSEQWSVFVHDGWMYPIFAQNLLWHPSDFFSPSWSLAIEEWFYLVLPLLLFCTRPAFKKPATAIVTVVVLIIIFFTALRFGFHKQFRHVSTLEKVAWLRLDALMLGVLGAFCEQCHADLWRRCRGLVWIGAAIVICLPILLHEQLAFFDKSPLWRTLYFNVLSLGFALLLPYFSSISGNDSWLAKAITLISTISYSTYLCQVPIISFTHKLFVRFAPYITEHLPLVQALITWAIIGIVSYFVYVGFELPVMKLRDRFKFSSLN